MVQAKTPEFSSLASLKSLYSELGAPHMPYYKTLVRVFFRRGGSFLNSVVHLSDQHAKLTTKGYRASVSKVAPLTWTDHRGRIHIRQFIEFTCGALYAPMVMSNAVGRAINYEWALILKIDGDLAQKKTGDVSDGLVHYLDEATVIINDDIRLRREKYLNRNCTGRPRKSNTVDLLERYGADPEVARWIRSRRNNLDTKSFHHDGYEDQVSRDSIPLENYKDQFESAGRNPQHENY